MLLPFSREQGIGVAPAVQLCPSLYGCFEETRRSRLLPLMRGQGTWSDLADQERPNLHRQS